MTDNPQREPERRGGGLPLILALLLLCGVAWCCWQIWTAHKLSAAQVDTGSARKAALIEERDTLSGLKKMSPCEIRDWLIKHGVIVESGALEDRTPKKKAPEPSSKDVLTPEDVERACVFIASLEKNKNLTTGSGFFVAPGYVVTNRHVVRDNAGKILVTSKALGKPVMARLVAMATGDDNDYALLQVKMPENSNVRILPFNPTVKKTERVGAWGFPDVVGKNDPKFNKLMDGDFSAVPELSYSEGVVSAILDRKPPVIVHTAPISPGNSGGPLVNQSGQLVGINSMFTLDEDSYRQASIALAATALASFLEENGVNPVEIN